MTRTFKSVFYSNAIDRNMSGVSDKLLSFLYIKNRNQAKIASLSFQVYIQT